MQWVGPSRTHKAGRGLQLALEAQVKLKLNSNTCGVGVNNYGRGRYAHCRLHRHWVFDRVYAFGGESSPAT
jgi:hypothetical protein